METEKDKLIEMMENMDQPSVDVSMHQKEFRLTLLNVKKSAFAGIILLIMPLIFLTGVILKHYLQLNLGILTFIYEWIGNMDQRYGDKSILNWFIRTLLILGPLLAIALNLIAVTYYRYEKSSKELILSFKLKWLNWLIILICSLVFAVFFLYLVTENF